jgi:hypothetical protein
VAITTYSDTDYDKLFKRNYLKLADNLYNTYDNIVSQAKKTFGTLGGYDSRHPVEVTFGGSIGSSSDGTLPTAYHSDFLEPVYTPKRGYARINIDNMTMEISTKKEWAFARALDQETTAKLKSFNRWEAAKFFNDGSGALGTYSAAPGGTDAAPTVVILNSGNYFRRHAYFEKGDYVNIGTLGSVFRITAYASSTGTVTLARVSGSDNIVTDATTGTLYMQNSKDTESYGLLGMVLNTTHYGVAEEFRYQPFEDAAGSAPLDLDMLINIEEQKQVDTDEQSTHFAFPPYQYRQFLKILEDQKRFPVATNVKPRPNKMTSPELIAKVTYGAIEYVGPSGNIMCQKNKFIRPDIVWAINMNQIECAHVKKPGWATKDGRVLLRMEDRDAYEARYVCYRENIFNPFHVGQITGLATS